MVFETICTLGIQGDYIPRMFPKCEAQRFPSFCVFMKESKPSTNIHDIHDTMVTESMYVVNTVVVPQNISLRDSLIEYTLVWFEGQKLQCNCKGKAFILKG